MRTFKKKNYKYIGEICSVIREHVKLNIKDYLIVSIVFILGILIGVLFINSSDNASREQVIGYINSFITSIKNHDFEINRLELTKITIFENIKLIILMGIAGTTIIGLPLIYLVILYKGIRLGYTISAIVLSLGSLRGFSFSLLALFLQNFMIIPVFFMVNVSSVKFYRALIGKEHSQTITRELIGHAMRCLVLCIPVIAACFIYGFVLVNFLIYFIEI